MPARDEDAAKIKCKAPGGVGLLLVDVINPLDFPGAEALAPAALACRDPIATLRAKARAAGTPVIYVNDNYGHWSAERSQLVDEIANASTLARALVDALEPRSDDYFVIKPQFSGFYATNLPVLLPKLGVSRVVIAGFATDICVLFTAADAHMREYDLWVPADTTASENDDRRRWALQVMANSMEAQTESTDAFSLEAFIRKGG